MMCKISSTAAYKLWAYTTSWIILDGLLNKGEGGGAANKQNPFWNELQNGF